MKHGQSPCSWVKARARRKPKEHQPGKKMQSKHCKIASLLSFCFFQSDNCPCPQVPCQSGSPAAITNSIFPHFLSPPSSLFHCTECGTGTVLHKHVVNFCKNGGTAEILYCLSIKFSTYCFCWNACLLVASLLFGQIFRKASCIAPLGKGLL